MLSAVVAVALVALAVSIGAIGLVGTASFDVPPAVALLLGAPSTAAIPTYCDRIRAMAFGVALAGLLVQAVSLPWLIRALDIGERTVPAGEFEWAQGE